MVHKPKSVQFKVIAGYLLLFAVAAVSVWFVYQEIRRITGNTSLGTENTKIIRVSGTIAALYSSEAVGRSAILSAEKKELKKYFRLTDSISAELDALKESAEPAQQQKFDSIKLLVTRKKNSVAEIFKFHEQHADDEYFTNSITGIKVARDSVWNNKKPVKVKRKDQFDKLAQALLTPKAFDSLSKLPVSLDTVTMAYQKVLQTEQKKTQRINTQLYRKEQKLLEENRVISDQLRVLLTNIENEFVQRSYRDINKTTAALNKTGNTMAWVGAFTFLVLMILTIIIIRDLGINQKYRRQLELLNGENEELLRTKGMLMATVTHDLQTPLGSIIGFYGLLKKTNVNDTQKRYLENINESAGYIMSLVSDLLDFSRLENNRISIEQVPVNIKLAIENTCSALQPMAEQKGIELTCDVDDRLERRYMTDPYRVKQILTNLVSNAVKFTNEGSVEITGKIDGFDIVISVIDTGIGIAPEKHAAVFREFTQAHSGIEKKFGGTGLGLTISKRIVELLGGSISLESEEGKGTIFTITLPCIAAPKETEIPVEEEPETESHCSIRNKKILVVDDDTNQLQLMRELLQNEGAEVTTDANSLNALKLLDTRDFDAILTDIQMPVLDGFGFVEKIRNHTNSFVAELPVIALSGRRDADDDYFISRGFTARLKKPVNINKLLAVLSGYAIGDIDADTDISHDKLYDLRSLTQFTQNDPASLKLIIDTFTESTADNCIELLAAAKENDLERLSRIAHKMIPMLRQMEVYSIAEKLIPLEDREINLPTTEMRTYCKEICDALQNLCIELQKETA